MRITTNIRTEIIKNATKENDEKITAIESEAHALAERIYSTLVTNEIVEAALKLPEGMVVMRDIIGTVTSIVPYKYTRRGFHSISLRLKKPMPMPDFVLCDEALCDEVLSLRDAFSKIADNSLEIMKNIKDLVLVANTKAKLLKAWPDAVKYLPPQLLDEKENKSAAALNELLK